LSAEAQGYAGDRGHGRGAGAPFWCAADSGLEPWRKGAQTTVWLDELRTAAEMAAAENSRW
jgi:hypothetical protein